MDDDVLAGPPLSVSNARDMILVLPRSSTPSKSEFFNRCNGFKPFPLEIKTSNLDILYGGICCEKVVCLDFGFIYARLSPYEELIIILPLHRDRQSGI